MIGLLALADTDNAGGGIAVEDRAVFCERYLSRCILGRLQVRILGSALHVVDLLAIEFERDAQLGQRLDFTLSREDAVARRGDRRQVARANGR